MENKKCMVTELSNGLLEGIIKSVFLDNDIDVYQCSLEQAEENKLLISKIDYLIVDMNQVVPPVCQELFDVNVDLIIIEILNNGKSLSIYIDDVGEVSLNKIINLK